jgi:uncharacterized protein
MDAGRETARSFATMGTMATISKSRQEQDLIDHLKLLPHPEGGYYREVYRSQQQVKHPQHGHVRAACTSIYFLLPHGTFSAFHRVASDELWHHLGGGPLELITINAVGKVERIVVGNDLQANQVPMGVVPAGVWQAARPMNDDFSWCGCTVSPGFDFADFEMPSRQELLTLFPKLNLLIESLTRLLIYCITI